MEKSEKKEQDKKKEKEPEKKENKSEKEKSEENLEEEISGLEENIDNDRLMQFLQSREKVVPVLERVVKEIPKSREIEMPQKEIPKERFQQNYSSLASESENKKYQPVSPVLSPISRRENSQAELLDPMSQRRFQDNLRPQMIETGIIAETRKLPFEAEDRKYKEVKFKKFV